MNTAKVIVAGVEMDLKSGVGFGLNYSIADVKKLDKKNSNYSKSITLVGSKPVNKLMGGLFDVNADFTFFNPNIKTDAKIIVNSSTVIEGVMQLKSIDIIEDVVEYKCVIVSKTIDFISAIKGKFLNELDFTRYDHDFTGYNVHASWGNTEGYVYPLFWKGSDDYDITDFTPSIFYKTYLKKIAEEAGYSLGGSLMDTTTEEGGSFAKEIIPFAGTMPLLPAAEFTRRKFRAAPVADVTFANTDFTALMQTNQTTNVKEVGTLNVFSNDSTGTNFDNGGLWNTGSSKYVVDARGKYDVNLQVSIESIFSTASTEAFQVGFNKNNTGYQVNQWLENSRAKQLKVIFRLLKNGLPTSGITQGIINAPVAGSSTASTFNAANSYSVTNQDVFNIDIKNQNYNVGDEIEITYEIEFINSTEFSIYLPIHTPTKLTLDEIKTSSPIPVDINFKAKAVGSFIYNTPNPTVLSLNDTVSLNTFIPSKIKQTDLVTDLVKRLNIYISIDPDNDRKIILDTRDSYYAKGAVVDWSKLRDKGSKETIKLLSDLQNKDMLFTYKQGNDDSSLNYFNATEQIYGQKAVSFSNDFAKGEKKIESIFASTVLIPNKPAVSGLPSTIVSHWNVDPALNKGLTIMYYNGFIDTIENREYRIHFDNSGSFFWSKNYYPFAGHLDNPINPTLDLNFGAVAYPAYPYKQNSTDANIYNRYWKNYVNQIDEGKLVTMYFDLNEVVIDSVRKGLNVKVWAGDSYYFINSIVDYDPINEGLTKVELLKVKEGVPFVKTNNVFDTLGYDSSGGSAAGAMNRGAGAGVQARGVGEDNSNASKSSWTVGQGNVIEDGVEGGFISGDYNVIAKGVTGGFIIGSSNKTITQNNEGWIGNVRYLNGSPAPADTSLALEDLFTLRDSGGLIPGLEYHAVEEDFFFKSVTSNELNLNGSRLMMVIKSTLYSSLEVFNRSLSYNVDDRVIWGGRVWYCITSGQSASSSKLLLNSTNWLVSRDEADYEYKIFGIKFSETSGNILEQYDDKGNTMQNDFTGGLEFSDWNKPNTQRNECTSILNNDCNVIEGNKCLAIEGNQRAISISGNKISGNISNNIASVGGSFTINQNYNNGSIENNTCPTNISISNNNNNGNISGGARTSNITGSIVNL